jgi:multidrug efflux system membrane fusion protein
MRKTYITASVVAIAIVLWIGSGFLREESPALPQSVALKNLALQAQNEDRPLTSVRVSTSYASDQDRSIRVRGQTQPERSVEVQAQISGLVRARPANRGDRVRTGDLLCEITVEDRNAESQRSRCSVVQSRIGIPGRHEASG